MNKRLVYKLCVMVAALGAVSLLQGCDWNEQGVTIGGAWMPVGMGTLPAMMFGTSTGAGTASGGNQGSTGATAGAVAAGGGGNQVSTGTAVQ